MEGNSMCVGDYVTPRFYEPYTCAVDGEEGLDPIEQPYRVVGGKKVRLSCAEMCPVCMEWIDDASIAMSAKPVSVHDWSSNWKLSTMHAMCAAAAHLEHVFGIHRFDPEVEERETIERLYREAAAR